MPQDFFCPSSKGWPPFMRINPVLNWAYRDVWEYLHLHDVPVCPLYYQGYTSLGSTSDTTPNPSLLRSDGTYAPAHELAGALRTEHLPEHLPEHHISWLQVAVLSHCAYAATSQLLLHLSKHTNAPSGANTGRADTR